MIVKYIMVNFIDFYFISHYKNYVFDIRFIDFMLR